MIILQSITAKRNHYHLSPSALNLFFPVLVYQGRPVNKGREEADIDNFVNERLRNYMIKEEIKRQLCTTFSSTERRNRYLTEMIKYMLQDSKLDKTFWVATIVTSCYLKNRLSSYACEKTPFEIRHGGTPFIRSF